VIIMGMLALQVGVGFSERPGVPEQGFFSHLYYTIGLFVLGGIDVGIPDGGPTWARRLLWLAYFAAPAITTASVIEGVLRAMAPARWRLRRLRGHIIVVGCGRTGRLYLRRMRESRPHKSVLMVDIRPDHPAVDEIREVYRAQFLSGDIRDQAVLDGLRLEYADRVFLFTGDDFANLDAAARIRDRVPALARRMVVHVANLHFFRVMEKTLEKTPLAESCKLVNKYLLAAEELVRTDLSEYFSTTDGHDIVVLAGFGRFGQTVLHELQRIAGDKFDRVVIIDVKAGEAAARFDQHVGFRDSYRRQIIEGDLRDPRVWKRVEGIEDAKPVFIIGSGDDSTNLSTALWIAAAFPNAHVLSRGFYRSMAADLVSKEGGFKTFAVAELVAHSMSDDWFGIS
jgi:voltage-gated potassium channel Kch